MSNYSMVLCHEGVKGMHWGERRAEWYPIEAYQRHLKNQGYTDKQIKKATTNINKSEAYKLKAQKYKTKVPDKYLTDFGKAKAEKYTRKATSAEGKAYKIAQKIPRVNNEETSITDEQTTIESSKTKEEIKRKAIANGDLSYAKAHVTEFSTNELNDVINRHTAMTRLDSITAEEANIGKQKVEKLKTTLGTAQDISGKIANTADNAVKLYNTSQKIKKIIDSSNNKNKE